MIYSVFIGKYKIPKIPKSDLKKLNSLGYSGYLFSRNDYYSVKVTSTPKKELADAVAVKFRKLGFLVEIDCFTNEKQ
jgi:hypothetical protein